MDRPSPPATNEYFPTTTHVVRRTRVERIFEGEEGGIEHVFVDALDFFFFLNPPNAIPSTNLSLSRIYIFFHSVQICAENYYMYIWNKSYNHVESFRFQFAPFENSPREGGKEEGRKVLNSGYRLSIRKYTLVGTSGRENAIKVNLPPPIPWLMT